MPRMFRADPADVPVNLSALPGGLTTGLVGWWDSRDPSYWTVQNDALRFLVNRASGVQCQVRYNTLTVNPTGLNGFPCFVTNGVDSIVELAEAAVLTAITPGTAYTLYMLVQETNPSTIITESIIAGGSGAPASTEPRTRSFGRHTFNWNCRTVNNAAGVTELSTEAVIDLVPHVHCWHGNGATGANLLDGYGNEPLDGTADVPGTTTMGRAMLFGRPNDSKPADQFATSKVGIVMLYSGVEHTASEQATVIDALRLEWNLFVPLPAVTPDPSIVDIIMMEGQSNDVGIGEFPPNFPAGYFHWINDIGFDAAGFVPLGTHTGITGPNEFGPELMLARRFVEAGLTPLPFVVGEGGTYLITSWYPPATPDWIIQGIDWPNFLTAARAQYPGKSFRVHFVWIQGENEAGLAPGSAAVVNYATDLATLTAAIRTQVGLGTDVYLHIAQLGSDPGSKPSWTDMQAQQATAAANITNARLYVTTAFPKDGAASVHYTSYGYDQLGDLIARGILTVIGSTTLATLPP